MPIKPIPIRMSPEEINYNLDILANTLSDENAEVDKGYIEIFENAIRNLNDNSDYSSAPIPENVTRELTARAESIALKVNDRAIKHLIFGDRPFVGEPQDLAKLADLRKEGPVKDGMNRLADTFDMKSVAADNHCLFRSIMTGYLANKWCKLPPQERATELRRLESLSTELSESLTLVMPDGSPRITKTFTQVREILSNIGDNPTQDDIDAYIDGVMNDRDASNCLVAFSRMLASGYYMQNPLDTLAAEAMTYNETPEEYLGNMATFQKNRWGSDSEINALANNLGLRVQVNDVFKVGEGNDIDPEHQLFGSFKSDPQIDILFFPGHYNLGVRKPK